MPPSERADFTVMHICSITAPAFAFRKLTNPCSCRSEVSALLPPVPPNSFVLCNLDRRICSPSIVSYLVGMFLFCSCCINSSEGFNTTDGSVSPTFVKGAFLLIMSMNNCRLSRLPNSFLDKPASLNISNALMFAPN